MFLNIATRQSCVAACAVAVRCVKESTHYTDLKESLN